MVEAKSELLIPPLKHAQLGKGVNRSTGELMPSPFKTIPKINEPILVKERDDQAEITISSSEDFANKVDLVAGLSVSGFGCQAAGKYAFHSLSFSKKASFQCIIFRRITFPTQLVDLNSLLLHEDAEEILRTKGIKEFYRIFGEYFIAGEQRGVSGALSLDVISDDKSKKASHSAELQVKGWVASGDLKVDFEKKMESSNLRYEAKHTFSGIDKSKGKGDGSLASNLQLIKNLDSLAEKDGIVISYVVLPYTHCPRFFKYLFQEQFEEGVQISRSLIQDAISKEYIQLQYLLKKYEGESEAEDQLYKAIDALVQNESKITLMTLSQYKKASSIEYDLLAKIQSQENSRNEELSMKLENSSVKKTVFTILVVGSTGVGKSSLINLFYIWSQNYDLASIPTKRMLIKTRYLDGDNSSEWELEDFGEPRTRLTKMHKFNVKNESEGKQYLVRLIDTPPIGSDNRGSEHIEFNLKNIARAVSSIKGLNAVLFIINGGNPKLDSWSKYTLAQFKGIVPDAIQKNLFVLLSNVDQKPNFRIADYGLNVDPKKVFSFNNGIFNLSKEDFLDSLKMEKIKTGFDQCLQIVKLLFEGISRCKIQPLDEFKRLHKYRRLLEKKLDEYATSKDFDNKIEAVQWEARGIIQKIKGICSTFDYLKELEAYNAVLKEQIELEIKLISQGVAEINKIETLKQNIEIITKKMKILSK